MRSVKMDADSANFAGGIKTLAKFANGREFGARVNYSLNLSENRRIHALYAGLELGF